MRWPSTFDFAQCRLRGSRLYAITGDRRFQSVAAPLLELPLLT